MWFVPLVLAALAPMEPTVTFETPAHFGRAIRHGDGTTTFLGHGVDVVDRPVATWAVDVARDYFVAVTGGALSGADLQLVAVEPVARAWSVRFVQTAAGVPIHGAHALASVGAGGVRFASHLLVPPVEPPASPALSSVQARARAHDLPAARVRARGKEELAVVFGDSGPRLAWRVEIDTEQPWAWWAVFVDAHDGTVLAREQLSVDGVDGTVSFEVEPVCQGAGTEVRPMPHVQWTTGEFAGDDGRFHSDVNVARATVSLSSPYITLVNHGGDLAGPWDLPLVASPADNELEIRDAPLDQIDPFYHAHRVRGWLRGRVEDSNSQTRWADEQLAVHVNLPDTCNAYFNGDINFFRAGNGCNNTGRVAGIVFHEYGHGVHVNSTGSFDGQVSEGIADFVAATINDDPHMRGLFDCTSMFRTCANDLTYCDSGCDLSPRTEVHAAGPVMCAVWWELREQLVDRYGYDLGVATTDRILLEFLNHVGTMNSAYDAAIAADDDDDGDPANGTKHSCEINRAFANDEPGATAHFPDLVGMIPSSPSLSVEHESPGRVVLAAGEAPTLEFVLEQDPGCAEAAEMGVPVLHYQVNGGPTLEQPLESVDGDRHRVVLDETAPASVTYWLTAALGPADFIYPYQGARCPRGANWPCYRQSVHFGSESEQSLFASDFESDDGGLTPSSSGADLDFEWGAPGGSGGDPSQAHSGEHIWGTDIGAGDGLYAHGETSALDLPVLDASESREVRLVFWRQLQNADRARILVNDREVWSQRWTTFFWRDPVWTFATLDISEIAAGHSDVRIRFVMDDEFEDSFELGGWNLDDIAVWGLPADSSRADDSPVASSAHSLVGGCRAAPTALAWLAVLLLGCRLALRSKT